MPRPPLRGIPQDGLQPEQFTVLETMISQQHDKQLKLLEKVVIQEHGKLRLLIEERLNQQSRLLDSRLQTYSEQAPQRSTNLTKRVRKRASATVTVDGGMSKGVAFYPTKPTGGSGAGESSVTLSQHSNRSSPPSPAVRLPENSISPPSPSTMHQMQMHPSTPTNGLDVSEVSAQPQQSNVTFGIGGDGSSTVSKTMRQLHRGVHHIDSDEEEKDLLPINHPIFVAVIYTAILINALQLGVAVEINGGAWDSCWRVLDHVFTAIFAGEMIIKLYYLRRAYFVDRWNLLDFVVALTSILDSWVIPLVTGGDGGILLKMLQFLRLLRMFKVLRMRRDLLALVEGLMASLKSMYWVSLLLLLAIYTAAILCVDVIGSDSVADDYTSEGYDNIKGFGTLGKAMLTLFSISILDTWSTVITPISNVQPYLIPFFLIFLITTSFALMNSIIGIIVEQTSAATAKVKEMDERKKREMKRDRVSELMEVLDQIDESPDGIITAEEMLGARNNVDFQAILRSIDLPPGFTVADLHLMLDKTGGGMVSKASFLEGMFQLIFCNDFQRQCLSQLSMAQIRRSVFELGTDLFEEVGSLKEELSTMKKLNPAPKQTLAAFFNVGPG